MRAIEVNEKVTSSPNIFDSGDGTNAPGGANLSVNGFALSSGALESMHTDVMSGWIPTATPAAGVTDLVASCIATATPGVDCK
jgi:hypothetical protein